MRSIRELADAIVRASALLNRYSETGEETDDLDDLIRNIHGYSQEIYRAEGDDEARTLSGLMVGAGMASVEKARNRLKEEGRWRLVPR